MNLGELLFGQDFSLIDPHLDAYDSVNGLGGCDAVVDIGSKRVKGNLSKLIELLSRDFRTVQSSAHHHLHSATVESLSSHHGLSHGASVADSLFELNCDVFGNELGIEFGLSDFGDVDLNLSGRVILAHHSVEVLAHLIDALTASSDDRAGSRREDRYLDSVCGSFDFDTRHKALTDLCSHELSNLLVACKGESVLLLVVEPVAVMPPNDSHTETSRVNFLTH